MTGDSTSAFITVALAMLMAGIVTYIIRICALEIRELDKRTSQDNTAGATSESRKENHVDGPVQDKIKDPRSGAGFVNS